MKNLYTLRRHQPLIHGLWLFFIRVCLTLDEICSHWPLNFRHKCLPKKNTMLPLANKVPHRPMSFPIIHCCNWSIRYSFEFPYLHCCHCPMRFPSIKVPLGRHPSGDIFFIYPRKADAPCKLKASFARNKISREITTVPKQDGGRGQHGALRGRLRKEGYEGRAWDHWAGAPHNYLTRLADCDSLNRR